MSDMSSLGRVPPRMKSINVEANLLSARLAERARVAEASRKRLLLIGAVLGVLALAAPPLYQYQIAAGGRVKAAQVENDKVAEQLAVLQKQVDEATPKVQESEMVAILREQADDFLGQLVYLMNSTTSGVAISGVKADVMAATMTLTCNAEAESFEEAQAFASNAKAGPDVKEVFLSSARQSTALGVKGMGFDLVKRVAWE